MREMVQVRITAPGKHFIPEGYVRQGQVLWVRAERADVLINKQRIAEPAAQGPTEAKPAGPSEKKDVAGAAPASPSTDSAKSPEPGAVAPPSVLREDRASRTEFYEQSTKSGVVAPKKRGRAKKSA